jgi:SAM-dependent methyltransferase
VATAEERRQLFGSSVEAYDRTRPGYPVEAVRWCLGDPDTPLVVCDLGAGTGKLTRTLLELGHTVVAVEPDERMLARLRDNVADMPGLVGTFARPAEDLPVDDGSVDAVIAGQAWHWFDQDAVGRELDRVLRADGIASALWYGYDTSVDWVDRWTRIIGTDTTPVGRAMLATDVPLFGDWAGDLEEASFRHEQSMTPTDLVDRAASTSPVIALDPGERAAVLNRIAHLVATHPDLAGGTAAMPYEVECFRATRRPRGGRS